TADDTHVTATLWTGRESGVANLVFERAPDVGGAPGAFLAVDSLPATGDPSLAGPVSVHAYARTWAVPTAEHGQHFWYRGAYSQAGHRYAGAAVEFTSPLGPSVATLVVTL